MAGRRVLIVEDDRFLRRAAEARLRQEGFGVLTAADGEEGLRVACKELPDLILLDLIMPKMQGFEVLRALKRIETTAGIPIIILSNLSQETDRTRCLEAGAAGYLVKANLSLQELVRVVESTVGPKSTA
jgi:DNA-binding response OmpR family regulator